ncbi:hypothetical protein LguiA_021018 [Lonicera macranthoides]
MQEPPERLKVHDSIRRTTEKDVLSANSIQKFGRKIRRGVRQDTAGSDHENFPIRRINF